MVGWLARPEAHLSRNSVVAARSIYPSIYRVNMGTPSGMVRKFRAVRNAVEVQDQVRMTLFRLSKVRTTGKASVTIY